jgi:ATP-binding cassette, subfamily B (MDR/TAP), member 1
VPLENVQRRVDDLHGRLLASLYAQASAHQITLPAACLSTISGGIASYMTLVIGRSFDAFAHFSLSHPSRSNKSHLLHCVGTAALELFALGAGTLTLSTITSSLWIWTGEYNAMALRKRVYDAVTRKDMTWFYTKMGAEGTVQTVGDEPLGASGLTASFSKYLSPITHPPVCLLMPKTCATLLH